MYFYGPAESDALRMGPWNLRTQQVYLTQPHTGSMLFTCSCKEHTGMLQCDSQCSGDIDGSLGRSEKVLHTAGLSEPNAGWSTQN